MLLAGLAFCRAKKSSTTEHALQRACRGRSSPTSTRPLAVHLARDSELLDQRVIAPKSSGPRRARAKKYPRRVSQSTVVGGVQKSVTSFFLCASWPCLPESLQQTLAIAEQNLARPIFYQ